MKNILLSLLLVTSVVFASAQQELITRLDKMNSFTAIFNQTVISPEGEVISEAEGNLAMQRPNLFNWKTIFPDETLLVSDGRTLWYYNNFIEQVTAMWLDDAASQTPFVLLTRNNPRDWQNYNVRQNEDTFVLSPKNLSNMGKFVVSVRKDGCIIGFSVVAEDGQTSFFTLKNVKDELPSILLFRFTVPEGIELDDQRQ
ncbi:outer membrane lipoprotein chaperone LolA [Candidatus Enterovibrio escicola]|uniref:Outer-membrane lipoprotein carrier protein n=1 Tax=Candidatus Enterovibrio escicola TaxID=1927127 RepID=A0A2A5T299_9GAMM|nr:outer membrane lipoprotein chaperone LolA [Candidatus Enterovibrio escacola]PCS22282.1 Outer membrane lipoprotein carrier protein LolA [Candidatus Enterovibrio escacola]